MKPLLVTLVYCVKDGRVLLLKRERPPWVGLWIGPGGKVEDAESPFECAIRELREETGATCSRLHFRGVIRESSPSPSWQWLIFIYVATDVDGALKERSPEGELRWWPTAELASISMPESDQIFLPRVLDLSQPPYQAHYLYNEDELLIAVHEH